MCWVTPHLQDRQTQSPGHSAKPEVMLFNAGDWKNKYDPKIQRRKKKKKGCCDFVQLLKPGLLLRLAGGLVEPAAWCERDFCLPGCNLSGGGESCSLS